MPVPRDVRASRALTLSYAGMRVPEAVHARERKIRETGGSPVNSLNVRIHWARSVAFRVYRRNKHTSSSLREMFLGSTNGENEDCSLVSDKNEGPEVEI